MDNHQTQIMLPYKQNTKILQIVSLHDELYLLQIDINQFAGRKLRNGKWHRFVM